jgi:hypothetical protein
VDPILLHSPLYQLKKYYGGCSLRISKRTNVIPTGDIRNFLHYLQEHYGKVIRQRPLSFQIFSNSSLTLPLGAICNQNSDIAVITKRTKEYSNMVTYIRGVTTRRGTDWMIIYCTYKHYSELHAITMLSLIYTLYSSPSHTHTWYLNLH